MIDIYTDGGCRNNPNGPGAWAFAVVSESKIVHWLNGYSYSTTNNEMELTAILEALHYLSSLSITECRIHSDSMYAVNAINVWYDQWVLTNSLRIRSNVPLLQEIRARMTPQITLHWVKGHSGNPYNDYADKLVKDTLRCLTPGGQWVSPLHLQVPLPPTQQCEPHCGETHQEP